MSRIAETFAALRRRGEKGLIPFFTAGDPDLATSERICLAAAAAGADIIELGLPFSDPLADGPIIQAGNQRALRAGTTTRGTLELIARLRQKIAQPIVLLTYYNPVFRYGVERFLTAAAEAGLDGLIVPDLPFEESGELRAAAVARGIDPICLLAPTSTEARIAEQVAAASGFIYCVSLTGVTGVREQLSDRAAELVKRVRPHTDLPLAVGFGISTPEQAAAACRYADAAIVGSALVKIVGDGQDDRVPAAAALAPERRVADFIASLKAAVKAA